MLGGIKDGHRLKSYPLCIPVFRNNVEPRSLGCKLADVKLFMLK